MLSTTSCTFVDQEVTMTDGPLWATKDGAGTIYFFTFASIKLWTRILTRRLSRIRCTCQLLLKKSITDRMDPSIPASTIGTCHLKKSFVRQHTKLAATRRRCLTRGVEIIWAFIRAWTLLIERRTRDREVRSDWLHQTKCRQTKPEGSYRCTRHNGLA